MSRLGRPRLHHRLTDSTNERAKELALAGAPHGTLVTADEQAAGRGRQGRSWTAAPGSAVLMSVILRSLDERHALLPLAAAVGACEAAESVAPVRCRVKWPNDVWIERRKLAGILVEARPQAGWAVLGIGLNVTTEELPLQLRDSATSLRLAAAGSTASTEDALAALLAALQGRLSDTPEAVVAAWRERDALRGSPVRWNGGEGSAAGIDDSGALLVQTSAGTLALQAGEVHLEP